MNNEENELNELINRLESNNDKKSDNNETRTSQNENKYVEKADFSEMIAFLFIITLISTIPTFIIDIKNNVNIIKHSYLYLIEFVVSLIIGCTRIRQNIIYKCPNCNEEIISNEQELNQINDNESSYKCPKCNCELLVNKKEKSVQINNIIEKVQESNNTNKIEELYNLKIKGIISEEEFENKKQELLNKM